MPNMSAYGSDTTFKSNGWAVLSSFCMPQLVSVDQSGSLSVEIGVLYLFHAISVLAELILCILVK